MLIFFTLTPLEGTLGKIFLTRKLYFRYSIVIEHQIKHLAEIGSGAELGNSSGPEECWINFYGSRINPIQTARTLIIKTTFISG